MKRTLSIILAALLLLTALSFTACANEPEAIEIGGINGKPVSDVYNVAMEQLENAPEYQVTVDLAAAVGIAFIKVPLEAGDIYVYSYKDNNSHHLLTDSGEELISNELLSEAIGPLADKVDKESWYIDGVLFTVALDGEKTVDPDGKPIKSGSVEEAVNSVVEKAIDDAKCYEQGTEVYLEVVLEGSDVKIGAFTKETYRVYFDDERITRMTVLCESELYSATINMHYSYEVEDITPPADIESFELR